MNKNDAMMEFEKIRAMSYEDLENQYLPLMVRMAQRYVPGLDFEDRLQELRVILYKCHIGYDPTKLSERASYAGFMSYLTGSLLNMSNKLRTSARRHYRPDPGLETAEARASGHAEKTGHATTFMDGTATCLDCRWKSKELRRFSILGEEALTNVMVESSFEDEVDTKLALEAMSPEAQRFISEYANLGKGERKPKMSVEVRQELMEFMQWEKSSLSV